MGNDILRCLIIGDPPLYAGGWGWGESRLWGPSSDILRAKAGPGTEAGPVSSRPGSTSSILSILCLDTMSGLVTASLLCSLIVSAVIPFTFRRRLSGRLAGTGAASPGPGHVTRH